MSSTRRFFGGLRERIAGVDDANRPIEPVQICLYGCAMCGGNFMSPAGALDCEKDDMLHAIYEKVVLGQEPLSSTRNESRGLTKEEEK